jgi:hypothetical protein
MADDMRRVWQRNKKIFSEKLREHGIVPLARFALLGKSFAVGGKTYSTTLTAKKSKDDEYDMERVTSINVELASPSLGKKSLFNEEYKGDKTYEAPLEIALAGAFKSPYEDRVAIVLLRVFRGWEGPPHVVDHQIIGADLRSGFKF